MAVDAGVLEAGPPLRRARLRLSGASGGSPGSSGRAPRPAARGVPVVYVGALGGPLHLVVLDGGLLHRHDRAHWKLENYRTIFHAGRAVSHDRRAHVGIAAAVTLRDAVLAFPLAYFMARLASKRHARLLFVWCCCRWSSYLVRIYAWQTILAHDGAINWGSNKLGLPDQPAYTNTAMWIVFTYVWLPFMVLPVYAALERIRTLPRGLGRPRRERLAHFPLVVLPLALPGIVAGSIFTFALTLGDYITPL